MSGHYEHLPVEKRELLAEAQRIGGELVEVAESGSPGRVNRPLLRALADHGLLGRLFDESAAAPDERRISALDLCLIREGLALACTDAETAFALQGLGSYPVLLAGGPELVAEWMPAVAGGDAVAAFALTEPEAGSDVAGLLLRAERDGSGWRLSGSKTFISNAPEADLYTVFARTSGERSARGITAFAVPGNAEGVGGVALELIAPHPIGRLDLDGVRVPDENVLGETDRGMGVAMRTLNLFRPSVGAFAIGMAQAAIDAAVEHTAAREAFGGRLRDFQAVSHRLAEMQARVQASRLLVHDAARATDEGRADQRAVVAMAKLLATETAQVAVDAAIQVHGGRALEQGHLLAHLYRDVRAPRIYEGASEIQREIIARALYGE
ncbi:MAG: acyl-CoA dehydrogenase family protein [Solirubrobacterales bacterium]